MAAPGPRLVDLALATLDPPGREELVPPPRFADCRFDTWYRDPAVPGQAAAIARIRAFATAPPGFWQRLWRRPPAGLYLDGDFGVGKTHLLAATWHAATGQRVFLSLAEAISLCVMVGPEATVAALAAELVCIDEFELDDPSNTRLADLLLDGLVARGCRIIVTSNTVPGELGAGRVAVDRFRAQLVRISAHFTAVHVPGQDYRQRHRGPADADPPGWGATVTALPGAPTIPAGDLDRLLAEIPVVNLRRLAAALPGLTVTGVEPFPDQLAALRFVHLVDRLYDHRVPLRVVADCRLDELFLAEYRDWAFAKKYRRCASRLVELCQEGARAGDP